MNAVQEARRLIERWQTADPFALCDCLHIRVLRCELPDSVRGFYHTVGTHRLIYLNQSAPPEEQREVCAHELGHAVLHTQLNSLFLESTGLFNSGKLEREADLFCAELVLAEPEEGETAAMLARRCGVSEHLVQVKYRIL